MIDFRRPLCVTHKKTFEHDEMAPEFLAAAFRCRQFGVREALASLRDEELRQLDSDTSLTGNAYVEISRDGARRLDPLTVHLEVTK